MSFPPAFLDEIRARVPLAEVIGRRVKLTRRGREHSGLCPFHNEKTPSFTVSDDKGFFHCFGCGAHGDVIGFVMRSEGLSFPEAVERLAAEAGLQVPAAAPGDRERQRRRAGVYDALEQATRWFQDELQGRGGAAARRYLEERGLTAETLAAFRIGFAPDRRGALAAALKPHNIGEALLIEAALLRRGEAGASARDVFFNRIIFPITDRQGRTIAFGGRALSPQAKAKYLNSPDSDVFHKGEVLFNLARARKAAHDTAEVVVVEGYMDVIALSQAGFPAVVAPLGTAITEAQIESLWRLAPEPVLCLDGDAAGRRAGIRAAERCLPLLRPGVSLRFAVLPEGEDPDSLVSQAGPEALRSVLQAARPLRDLLWQKEVEGRPLDTPERQAGLADRLDRVIKVMGHPELRAAYREDFARRFEAGFGYDPWQVGGSRRRRKGGDRKGARRGVGSARLVGPSPAAIGPAPENLQALQARQLLASLINHPSILAEVGEDVAALRLTGRDLERLRNALLDTVAARPDLDSDGLKCHLCERGFAAVLDRLLHQSVYRLARFARPESSVGEVRAAVTHILGLYRERLVKGDIVEAEAELAKDPTAEKLARFKARQELVHDGESRRVDLERADGTLGGDVVN